MPSRRSRSRSRSPRRDDASREEKKRKKRTGWDVGAEEAGTATTPGLPGAAIGGLGLQALAQQQNNLLLQNFHNKAMCRIYVGSLDYYLTELEIKSVFQAFGTIVSVDMPKEGDRSKGFCFVEYASPEAADMALSTMQNFVLKGRTIKVGRPTAVGSSGGQQLQRPLIMPNISPLGGLATTPTAGVAGALNAAAALGGGGAAAVGTPGMMLAGGGGGVSPGVLGAAAAGGAGHSSSMFNSAQAGAAAATAILAGRTGAVAENLAGLLSTSQGSVLSPDQQLLQQQLLQQQQQQVNNRVYIGNVPFGFSSEDLKKIFVVFGPILSCQLLPSQENPQQHRGYGFIEYATADAAKLAIETMNGFEVAGKTLKVNFATAMRSTPTPVSALASTLLPSLTATTLTTPSPSLSPGLLSAGQLGGAGGASAAGGGVLGQGLQQPHSTAAAAAAVAANHLLHTTTTATTPTPAPPPPLLAAGTTASPGGAHILSTPGLPGVSSSPAAGASGIPPSAGTIGGGSTSALTNHLLHTNPGSHPSSTTSTTAAVNGSTRGEGGSSASASSSNHIASGREGEEEKKKSHRGGDGENDAEECRTPPSSSERMNGRRSSREDEDERGETRHRDRYHKEEDEREDDEEGDKNRKHEERRGGKGGGLGRNSEEDHSHTFPPAPTKIDSRVVLLTNMVTPAEVDDELKDEVRQECSKFGEINRVEVHPLSDDVRIFVEFSSLTGAQEAIPSLHGRWFGGRQIIANTYSESSFAQGDFTH